jgi:hypothetical protein
MTKFLWVTIAALVGLACGSESDGGGTNSGGAAGGGSTSLGGAGASGGSTSLGGAAGGGSTSLGGAGGVGGSTGGTTSTDGGGASGGSSGGAVTCPATLPSGWLFCDDFEKPDVASRYFEYGDDEGDFVRTTDQAASGQYSMQVVFQQGEVSAGGMKLRVGNNPIGTDVAPGQDFDELFWRMRVMHQSGWVGSPAKLSRATSMAKSDWSQAMIAHLWSKGDVLLGDPASCVKGGAVACQGYNDFANLSWLGQMPGSTPIFATGDAGKWRCVEGHAKLNAPGQSDGVFEFWIDEKLEASRSDLNWRGTWTGYGINAVFFENYWNQGSPVEQKRWFDDIVIATVPIGCQ